MAGRPRSNTRLLLGSVASSLLPVMAECSVLSFLPRDALVHSAVLRLHVVTSICPSVCLSVCDVGGSGSHRLEILETNWTDTYPNTFALRGLKAIYLLSGEHGKIWGRQEVGWEKVACWSTKVAISLKRVKIEEKLLWRAYRKSQTLFRTVPSPTPYGAPSSRLGIRSPTPKLERLKLGTSNLVGLFTGSIRTQAPTMNFGEKGAWAHPETAHIF